MNIAVIDDEKSFRHVVKKYLSSNSELKIYEASNLDESKVLLTREIIDIALIDIRLSLDTTNRDGLEIIKFINKNMMTMPIVISNSSEIDEIKSAMKNGAYDYILKETINRDVILTIIDTLSQGIQNRVLKQQVHILRNRNNQSMQNQYLGISDISNSIREKIKRFAFSDLPVLVTGPTGTGKEITAKQLHYFSQYPDEKMLTINCAALPENLIESQLFGYKKGAFTGAQTNHEGYFQSVGKGTLFLDEIAELPLELQAKLLRVLENKTFLPIGSNTEQQFEGRIVTATHADLHKAVSEKRFREDLFYRLNVLEIELPALKERKDDIPLFISHFITKCPRKLRFTDDAMSTLAAYNWPGNIRQLRNTIDKVAILYDEEEITSQIISSVLDAKPNSRSLKGIDELVQNLFIPDYDGINKVKVVESALINHALTISKGNKSAAAKLLGINRKVIQRREEKPYN